MLHILPEAIERRLYDEVEPISGAEAMKWTRELTGKYGIFARIS